MRQRSKFLTQLTQSRADESAAAEMDPLVQLCAFFVGPEEYAVDIMRVEEILQPQRLTPIRGAPHFIEGGSRFTDFCAGSMACSRRYGFGSLHEKDIERAGSVHSLDADEFDVAGRAGSRDEGQRS